MHSNFPGIQVLSRAVAESLPSDFNMLHIVMARHLIASFHTVLHKHNHGRYCITTHRNFGANGLLIFTSYQDSPAYFDSRSSSLIPPGWGTAYTVHLPKTQENQVGFFALTLSSFVTLGRWLQFAASQFLYQSIRDSDTYPSFPL